MTYTIRAQEETGAPNGVTVLGGVREYWFPRRDTAVTVSQETKSEDYRNAAQFAIRYYDLKKGVDEG